MKTKRLLAMLLAIVMVFALVACTTNPDPEPSDDTKPTPTDNTPATDPAPTDTTPVPETAKIGVSMPTNTLQRWNQDGDNMKKVLEEKGYEVDLQFADNKSDVQLTQVENMINNGCKVLVIAAIDGKGLGTVLAQAKAAGIAVIAYDRLIMDSDAVNYYASFDNTTVGVLQGKYIEETLDLANAGDKTYNIEYITGSPDDNNMHFFFDGAMSVLQKYVDAGTLKTPSGQTEKMTVATQEWDAKRAQDRFDTIVASYYADTQMDAVMASNDSTALGVALALEAGYKNDVYPIITGQDCDIVNVKNIIAGKQSMSVFKDTRILAKVTAEMVDAIVAGTEPTAINDRESYDNGTGIIPAYLCDPIVVTIDNYKEVLLDTDYYTADDLA